MPISIKGSAPLLQVFDMPTSIKFYRDLLGFQLVDQSQPELGDDCDWAMLGFDGGTIMLNTAYERDERPSAADPIRVAHHDDTIIFFGCPDVDAAFEYFRSKGVKVEKPIITKYGYKAISLADPDGFGLTFHWPA
jgi:glyoxylase I family protein